MPDGGNPFFAISETNRPLCSVGVENTDLLSVGREYRLAVRFLYIFGCNIVMVIKMPN